MSSLSQGQMWILERYDLPDVFPTRRQFAGAGLGLASLILTVFGILVVREIVPLRALAVRMWGEPATGGAVEWLFEAAAVPGMILLAVALACGVAGVRLARRSGWSLVGLLGAALSGLSLAATATIFFLYTLLPYSLV